MAATGYTPISLYYSTTASAVPTAGNLANGELALNIADMKLYAKNSAGTVTLLASNASTTGVDSLSFGSTGLTPSTATTGAITVAGTLNVANGGTGKTSYTANGVLYASGTGTLANGSALTFDGTNFATTGNITSGGVLQALTTVQSSSGADLSLNANGANRDIIHKVNATELMRLVGSTGNLGIGTSSPVAKLQIKGTGTSGQVTSSFILENGSSGTLGMDITGAAGSSYWRLLYGGGPSTGTNSLSLGMSMLLEGASAGNVGIGTSSPGAKLQVAGATRVGSASGTSFSGSLTTGGLDVMVGTGAGTAGAFQVWDDNSLTTPRFMVTRDGNVGIGTSSPSALLQLSKALSSTLTSGLNIQNTGIFTWGIGIDNAVSNTALVIQSSGMGGTSRVTFSSAGGFSVGTTADPGAGAIYATGAITAYYSDERLKDVKGRIQNALAKVRRLSGVYYTNNETAKSFGYTSDEMQVGVLANQMKGELPEIVKPAPFDLDENNKSISGQNYMTVQYERGLPLLIEALKELADQFDDYVATH